ncbi:hypothetical protein ONQ60_26210, partial [Salmonella enterica subsp. enterica serovar Virginia]|nr:hypothetical protein [Salmonella enterica subsp. enterica serovar Virginia]
MPELTAHLPLHRAEVTPAPKAAPLPEAPSTVDVKVNLPASTSTPQPRPEKPVYLSVKADNTMFIGNDPVT